MDHVPEIKFSSATTYLKSVEKGSFIFLLGLLIKVDLRPLAKIFKKTPVTYKIPF